MADGKNFSGWFSGELQERAQKLTDRDFGGSASEMVKEAVRRLLDGKYRPEAIAPDIIVDLTRTLAGELAAADAGKNLKGIDQPRLLRAILRDLCGRRRNMVASHRRS